jgi:hypothetical protein
MFFTSCRTTRTVYRVIEIDFPEFPMLGDYEVLEGNRVATDEEYFRKLLIFRTLYIDEQEKYNEKKKLVEGEDNGGTK